MLEKQDGFTQASLWNGIVLTIGIIFILVGLLGNDFWMPVEKIETARNILISVGCSLVATAIVTYFNGKYQLKRQKIKELIDVWGLEEIFETRAIMNQEADRKQSEAKHCLDAIGFGFSSWRQNKEKEVIEMLKRGVKIRIISPVPDTHIILQRENDEEAATGQISKSIHLLQNWVEGLQKYGNIEIRFYKSLPLDFYFRIDDTLFLGPYLYKKQSQQTVSYQFNKHGRMFEEYKDYFETVWADAVSCER